MTASIKIYADDVENTLLFDSSRATIPTLFARVNFSSADLVAFPSGPEIHGQRLAVAGIDTTKHFCLKMYGTNEAAERFITLNPKLLDGGWITLPRSSLASLQWIEKWRPSRFIIDVLETN